MIWYILQSGIIWGLLYLIYWLFLKQQTFFGYNRLYLVAAVLIGLLAPLLYHYFPSHIYPAEMVMDLPTIYVGWMEAPMISANYEGPATQEVWWQQLPQQGIYLTIVALLLIRLLIGINGIWQLKKQAIQQALNQNYLLVSKKVTTPFSFFSWIFWNPKIDPQGEQGQHILAHEQAHARLFHSIDILFLEVIQILFWFNPILLLYKRAIRNVHEYQADAVVLQRLPVRPYGQLLLYQARYNDTQFLFVNHFLNSQIKKRIMMMTKTPSSRRRLWTYVLAIPVLLLCGLLFIQANMAGNIPENVTPLEKINSISDPDEMPVFEGCANITDAGQRSACSREHLFKYIIKEMKYPKAAKEAGIEGKALISFVIDTDGNVKDVKVEHDPGKGCGEEAKRIVASMPKWTPGIKDGKTVAVEMKLPFLFKLEDKEEQKLASDGADVMPVFAGCTDITDADQRTACSREHLFKYIIKEMKYPKAAKEAGIEGKALIAFTIDEEGNVKDVKIEHDPGKGCGEEAKRIVASMPQWTPGMKEGKAVAVEMKLPFQFKLDDKEEQKLASDGPDVMPVFAGCDASLSGEELKTCSNGKLFEFVGKNMRYPKTAVEGEVEGMVVVGFNIEADGSVANAKVLKGIGGGCDEEVIRVIYSMPNWQAGTKDGKAVQTEMRLPIKFVLNSAEQMNKQPLKYDLQLNDYTIAPNPSRGIIDLKFKGEETATSIRIFNQSGQMVYSQEESNFNGFFQKTIDLQNHGAGTYFIQIRQGGKAFTDQIIVQ